ncbi:hypothetical protein AK830_g6089 [Neonectria ditissima]|uniref:Uncharacterized protein n=1 Tax=Neonectria ditissima TaxID=78410 RepID=A0A0P7BHK2_9HYPO|nr:hypothetical protein AK830_g6089 [Neonectria ditissima]
MDTLTSLTTITSSTATEPESGSKQATYTTAGTLYDPSSSQPLQPPTRRGRSLKWAAGGAHSNLSLFPKSLLATLPLKGAAGRPAPVQHYTPLQQNYDRAVSPFSDLDHQSANMSAQVPLMSSGNTPTSLSSLLSEHDRDNHTNATTSDESDDDSDFGSDPLMNMTVKSLHNLASYPNPSQKRAQKALLRGAKPTLNGLSGAIRSNAPPSPLNRSLAPVEILKRSSVSPTLRLAQSDPLAIRKGQEDFPFKPEFKRSSTTHHENSPLNEMAHYGDSAHPSSTPSSTSTSMTLASGPGAPRPLTAGPPGQRQYRPSTFESTFKALHTNVKPQNGGTDEDEETIAVTQQTLLQASIDDLGIVSDSVSTAYLVAECLSGEAGPMTSLGKMVSSTNDGLAGTNDQHTTGPSWNQENDHRRDLLVPNSDWTWSSEPLHTDWSSLSTMRSQERWKAGTDRLTDEEVTNRNKKINRDWYSGSSLFGKTIVDEEDIQRKPEKTFGAIGDGRPVKNKDHGGPIKIAEANRMSVAEHAKPLLNMAFASVMRHVEEESCKSGLPQMERGTETPDEQGRGQASGRKEGQPSQGSQWLFGKKAGGEQ